MYSRIYSIKIDEESNEPSLTLRYDTEVWHSGFEAFRPPLVR